MLQSARDHTSGLIVSTGANTIVDTKDLLTCLFQLNLGRPVSVITGLNVRNR